MFSSGKPPLSVIRQGIVNKTIPLATPKYSYSYIEPSKPPLIITDPNATINIETKPDEEKSSVNEDRTLFDPIEWTKSSDTSTIVQDLVYANFTPAQAKAICEVMQEIIEGLVKEKSVNLIHRQDIENELAALQAQYRNLYLQVNSKSQEYGNSILESNFTHKMDIEALSEKNDSQIVNLKSNTKLILHNYHYLFLEEMKLLKIKLHECQNGLHVSLSDIKATIESIIPDFITHLLFSFLVFCMVIIIKINISAKIKREKDSSVNKKVE
jgi:hypothetical protein